MSRGRRRRAAFTGWGYCKLQSENRKMQVAKTQRPPALEARGGRVDSSSGWLDAEGLRLVFLDLDLGFVAVLLDLDFLVAIVVVLALALGGDGGALVLGHGGHRG